LRESLSITVEAFEGPCEVTVTQLDGNKGGQLGIKLVQLAGPSVVELVSGLEGDLAKAANAVSSLIAKLTPAMFEELKKELLHGAQAKYKDEFHTVDAAFVGDAFRGHFGSLCKLIGFALAANYRNFLNDLGISAERLQNLTAKAKKVMETQPGSKTTAAFSGQSGG